MTVLASWIIQLHWCTMRSYWDDMITLIEDTQLVYCAPQTGQHPLPNRSAGLVPSEQWAECRHTLDTPSLGTATNTTTTAWHPLLPTTLLHPQRPKPCAHVPQSFSLSAVSNT